MSGTREITSLNQVTDDEIKQRMIESGVPAVIFNELNLSELEKTTSEPLNFKNLYLNFLKIQEGRRGGDQVVLKKHMNRAWKLLCLTGQLPYINYAYQLILNDKILDYPDISPALQLDYNTVEAMNYTAYTGNTDGLAFLYQHVRRKDLLNHADLQRFILVNAVHSRMVAAVRWLVATLDIDVRRLGMVQRIFFMATEGGNAEMMRYAYEELKNRLDSIPQKELALFKAFESGDIPTIEYAHSLGLEYQSTTKSGDNGFHFAALRGHIPAMRFAKRVGIDPNSRNVRGITPLHNAAGNGDIPAMQCAIDLGARLDVDAHEWLGVLNFSASSGKLEAFKFIVSLMDPEVVKDKLNTDPDIIKNIIQSGMGVESIQFAVACGFNLFGQVDQFGSNLLIIAAASPHYGTNKEVVQYLLDAGLKPAKNSKNTSMLHMAALGGDPEMLRITVKTLREHYQKIDFTERDRFGANTISYAGKSENIDEMIAAIDELNAENELLGQLNSNYSLAKWDKIVASITGLLRQKGVDLATNPLLQQCTNLSKEINPVVDGLVGETELIHSFRRISYQLKKILSVIESNPFPADIIKSIQEYIKLLNTLMAQKRILPESSLFDLLPSELIPEIASHMQPRALRSLLSSCSFFSSSPDLHDIWEKKLAMQWQIVVGGQHTLLLHQESGQIFGFGKNDDGQLGLGYCEKQSTGRIELPDGCLAKQVAAGESHTLVLCTNGNLFGFGNNAEGQLGLQDLKSQPSPQRIVLPDGEVAKQVATSKYYRGCSTIVLCESNNLYSFGANKIGQLGLGYNSEQPVTTPTRIELQEGDIPQEVIIGGMHAFISCTNGHLYGFGDNSHGQLGLGDTIERQFSPCVVPLPDIKLAQISAGGFHTLILCKSGRLFSVGANASGQLGVGCEEDASGDVKDEYGMRLIALPTKSTPVQIVAAEQTSYVLCSNHQLYAFGINRWGQLGVGDTKARDVPELVPLHHKPLQVIASGTHTLILCKDNSFHGFGYHSYGQLVTVVKRDNFVKPFNIQYLGQLQKMLEEEMSFNKQAKRI